MIKRKNYQEDRIYVDGITDDYVWYQSKLLIEKMKSWQFEFERVVQVMESRHNEHLEMIDKLMAQNYALRTKKDD